MRRPEQALQQAAYKYIRYTMPSALCFHVPNSAKRSKLAGHMNKLMGVLPGAPDLLLFYQTHRFQTYAQIAAIEFKAGKGKQTDHQKAFQERWEALGGRYAICHNLDEVEASLRAWGAL